MTLFQSIILGAVQGLAEFLPISSSGHLALLEKFFGIEEPLSYAIFFHFGTLFSVIYFFRQKLKDLTMETIKDLKNKKLNHTVLSVIIVTLPLLVVVPLTKDLIEKSYENLLVIGLGFLVTSVFLFIAASQKKLHKNLEKITPKNSLIIGIFQTIATLPGISRSGSTIMASLSQGIKKEDAFYFSFLISLPAVSGALILDLLDFNPADFTPQLILGLLVSFLTGLLSIRICQKIVTQDKLQYFAIYTFVMAFITILLS